MTASKRQLLARMTAAATGARVTVADIIREGVSRVVQEFEAEGRIRMGMKHECGLRLRPNNLRDILWAAKLVEVEPETFLNWILAYECESLRDRDNGLMASWVNDLLRYDTPEEEARVKARWRKWLTSGPGDGRKQKNRKAWSEGKERAE